MINYLIIGKRKYENFIYHMEKLIDNDVLSIKI